MRFSLSLLVVLLLCSVGCGWRERNVEDAAKQLAESQFASLSSDVDHFVGMGGARVFGRDGFGLVNGVKIHRLGGGVRLASIPFWCAGVLDGREVASRREFRVRLLAAR